MKNTINNMSKQLAAMVSERKVFGKAVDKKEFKEYIEVQLAGLRALKVSLTSLTGLTGTAKFHKLLFEGSRDKSHPGFKVYNTFLKQLVKSRSKVVALEDKAALKSLDVTVGVYIKLLEDLIPEVDNLFKTNTVSILNAKLSHTVVIAVLTEAKLLYRFSTFLSGILAGSVSGIYDINAKYKFRFIEDNSVKMAGVIARAYSKSGSYNFQALIKEMKTKAIDISLLTEENQPGIDIAAGVSLGKVAEAVLANGFLPFNIFRFIGEAFVGLKAWWYEFIRTDKEWMEAHVALLQAQLDGIDPNSPEYKKLVEIIEKYEDMINEANKSLDSYENS